jgi:hypothetical protein
VIDGSAVLARRPEASRDASGLLIGDTSLHLNATALEVWDTFDGRLDVDEVVAAVAHRYGQTPAEVATEISRIVAALHAEGALLRVGGPARPAPSRVVPADEFDWALVRWARGGPPPRLPVLTGDDWPALLTHLRRERLDGLLLGLAASTDQGLDEQQDRDLRIRHRGSVEASQQLEQRLVEVHDLLAGAAIDHRVLKGLAHARLDYPRWDLRPSGDIDLLVPRTQLEEAAGLLIDAGGRRLRPEICPGYDARFAKALTVVLDDPRTEIDLHATLVRGPFGAWMRPAALFDEVRPLRIGGRDLPALSLSDAFVHACFTAFVAAWHVRPLALLDLLQLADQGPDPDRVWSLCRSWRASSVVAGACGLVLEHLPEERPLLLPWLRAPHRPSVAERLVIRAEGVPRRYVTHELLTVAVQPTAGDKMAYARALIARARARGLFSPRSGELGSWRQRAARALADLSTSETFR